MSGASAAGVEKQVVEFEMTITPILCNKNQVLHSGAAAMLVDMLTSAIFGMLVKPGYLDNGHVSWTLTITYLRPLLWGRRSRLDATQLLSARG
jgi:acyl-coenzyme A thioesterase 13